MKKLDILSKVGFVVVGCMLIYLVALIIISNLFLLDKNIVMTQDYAATAIGVSEASKLRRVYGTPSWNGYFHPGPILMYYRAFFELIASTTRLTANPIFIYIIAHLILVLGCLFGIYRGVKALTLSAKEVVLIPFSIIIIFIIGNPIYTYFLWEPHTAAILFVCFLVVGAAAIKKGPLWLAAVISLGGFCVQIQLTLLVPVALVGFAVIVGTMLMTHFRDIKRQALSILGGTFIASLPILIDGLLKRGWNIKQLIAYSKASAGYGKLSVLQATEIVQANLSLPSIVVCALILVVVVITAAFLIDNVYRKIKFSNVASDLENSSIGISFLAFLASLAILSAVLFYRFVASSQYAPGHATCYVYFCLGILVSAFIVRFLLAMSPPVRIATTALIAIVLAITGVAHMVSSGQAVFRSPASGIPLAVVPELVAAVDVVSRQGTLDKTPINIDIAFKKPGEGTTIERELPWSFGIAFAHLLRRAGISYCFSPADEPYKKHPERIMMMFGDAPVCIENGYRKAEFFCENGRLRLRLPERTFDLYEC